MKLPVILSPEAKDDYDEAGDYYEQSQPGLGSDFAAKVRKVLSRIGKMPQIHQVVFLGHPTRLARKVPLQRLLPNRA